jgi:hypothetical protein
VLSKVKGIKRVLSRNFRKRSQSEARVGLDPLGPAEHGIRTIRAMGAVRFRTTLASRGPAAAIVLGDDQIAELGQGEKRLPIVATVNGYSWRTTVARMRGEFLVGLSRAVRKEAGVEAGDTVEVRIELDTAQRDVELPQTLADALAADSAARAGFDQLAYTHRKEYARWISEAKRDETRKRRIAEALELLRKGKPRR